MRAARGALFIGALVLLAGSCGGGGGAQDGWVSVGTGDTYGEWELFAQVDHGAWTGCVRIEPGGKKKCGDPAATYSRYEFDGVAYGVAPDGGLEFADGGHVDVLEPDGVDRKFYGIAADAEIRAP